MEINNNYPLVTVCAPIRNREKFLPYYLDSILSQTFPKSNTQLLFVINNSTDDSENILNNFKKTNQDKYMKIRIEKYDRPNAPEYNRSKEKIFLAYEHLANVRNYILQQVKTEWMLSVDSDIMILPNTLETLLNSNKKCISALIKNGYNYSEQRNSNAKYKCDRVKPEMFTNIMRYNAINKLIHVPQSEWKGIIPINMTGAIYLMHRDIFKKCRYKADLQGEDIPFSKDVEALGEKLWCNTDLKCTHCMSLELLEKYKNEGFFF